MKYLMGIGEAEALSERLKRELQALEAANVHAILETEPLIDEVLQGLEIATNCVDDLDEWLGMFNVKLRHMREDIESIEMRNNKLEIQTVNNRALMDELDKLLKRLSVPEKYVDCLTEGSFGETHMFLNIEACEWLTGALHGFEGMNVDPCYANIRAHLNQWLECASPKQYRQFCSCIANYGDLKMVKEKRGELGILKTAFARRASEFLRNYFVGLVDYMLNDKNYFSQRGQLKRPDHSDLRYKCRTYARLLQHLKNLDKTSLSPLRKAYCGSLNLLLRREGLGYPWHSRS
ncbi:unnamed protein product [Thlaspi arvense]|uniref:Exocyst complex component Sec3 coiled-coil domain-containing protein n=1 Tax=Thlaspi arvense TaxID=13288 RepID=A0AAU9RGR5_THLAR|nr:unnamed protein product [Thlaspi arvense]